MEKDLIDYIVPPTVNEYRDPNVIDEINSIGSLSMNFHPFMFQSNGYMICDAVANYKNEIIVSKMFYAHMVKYQKYYEKRNNTEYDFLARKYADMTIVNLFSIYDKSYHIINNLYDLRIERNINFKKNVRNAIKEKDRKLFNRLNSIFSRLQEYDEIRNDIIHNNSCLYYRCIPTYKVNKRDFHTEKPLTYVKYKKIIDNIATIVAEQSKLINDKLTEIFPQKKQLGSDK